MATQYFKVSSTQDWIYPPFSYNGYGDNNIGTRPVAGYKWNRGHSVPDRRGVRCYQGGNTQMDGKYNGNMMSFFFFRVNGNGTRLHDWIKAIGGASKITRITLKVYCNRTFYSQMRAQICASPFWNPENPWNGGLNFDSVWNDSSAHDAYGLQGCPNDSYSGTFMKHIKTQNISRESWASIDLTGAKYDVAKCQSLALYVPRAYDRDNQAWGWVNGYLKRSNSQERSPLAPTLEIDYIDNSAPNAPTIRVNSAVGSHGYTVPGLDISVISNGDPDNNLDSSPYSYILYNQSGSQIHNHDWTSGNRYTYDLSGYRGQTVKIKGQVRDTYGLIGENYLNVYINSQPYWGNTGIWFSNGVSNNIYKGNVTLNWNSAYDPQPEHNRNLRYRVYVQKENDNGPAGDVWDNAIAESLTGTSFTIDARNMVTLSGKRITVNRGEKIYFSVWAHDGLEWSSNRAVSSWIYREKPPTKPVLISPNSGHFENGITVSWSGSSGVNGTTVVKYKAYLCDKNYNQIRSYETTSTSFVCNDLTAIARGDKFFFRVVAIDNLGTESEPLESSWLIRNSYPTTPTNFNPSPNQQWFKNNIPLAWGISRDPDNDAVKYDVFYNVNGGGYTPLTLGISETYCNHNISQYAPGTKFNYYIEAFDTFGIRSWKAYTSTQPQVNIPPVAPTILLPQMNRTIYCKTPRITFRINNNQTGKKVKVIMNINGKEYNSVDNVNLFNKQWYGAEEGMFIIPNERPLNYSKNNHVEMKVFDGLDYSSPVATNIPVEVLTVDKILEDEDRIIKADELNKIRQMINKNRFAYNLSEISWFEGVAPSNKILFKYFDQSNTKISELISFLNNKTNAPHLKRDSEIKETKINKAYFNKLLDMISKS